jgi:hypothetical protein
MKHDTYGHRSVYSLFSALIMHVYQMRSSVPSIVSATQERLQICMDALKEVSKVWLVAKMVHTLFLSILGNKVLEERLQKAPGKKHKKAKVEAKHTTVHEAQRPTYDDAGLGYTQGPPAAQVSYERSRPQTPAVTPSGDLGPSSSMPAPPMVSPNIRHNDTFLNPGASRGNTRPTTPFNPPYSVPATPPDFYLVTRNSPPISQSLWENFQPDQLFPESANMSFPMTQFAMSHQQNLDPQLHMPQMQTPNMQHAMPGQQQQQQQQQLPQRSLRASGDEQMNISGMQGLQSMQQGQNDWTNQLSPEDTWSNSSRGQQMPVAPTTLNVEDW